MVDQTQDYLFKIIIVGDGGTGKSNILINFCDEQFIEAYKSTIGVDFKIKTLMVGQHPVKLQLWDTAGQERYAAITSAYYRGAQAVIIVYDITNRNSFDMIKSKLLENV